MLRAKKVACSSDLEVPHGYAHAAAEVGVLVNRFEALLRFFGKAHVFGEHEIGVRLPVRASHAAFKLVHLREAEALRIFDDERVGMGVVDAAFDNRGGNEHIDLARAEIFHHAFELFFAHLAVRHANARFSSGFLHATDGFFDCAHAIAHVIYLSTAMQFAANGIAYDIDIPFAYVHFDGAPVARRRKNEAHVAHARKAHLHGAWNGRCRKREHVDLFAQVLELFFVLHAESLLFVDDDEAQVVRVHVARKQSMRADEHLHGPFLEPFERRLHFCRRTEARKYLDGYAEFIETVFERLVVLLRQNGRRAEHHDLLVVLRGFKGRSKRDLGFAEANVAAHEAIHRLGRLHVGLHFSDG